jgi:hypothetical protein
VFLPITLVLGLLAGFADAASAQSPDPSTRAESLRREREKKQQELRPNKPDTLQRALDYAEDRALHILTRDDLYPKVGSLTTGSGFALGLGYRNRDIFRRRGVAEIWGAATFKQYWALQARAAWPDREDGKWMAEAVADVREYPEESFFGLGPDSQRQNELRYSLHMSDITGRAGVRLAPIVLVGGKLGLFSPRTGAQSIDYVRSGAFVEVDYREPKYARSGGWYRLDFNNFTDRDDAGNGFRRTDLDLRQFIGFLADRRVIALRSYISTSEPEQGGTGVPFYLMPWLGGNDSLRGFRNYRFRGPHALLLQAEYRWELWSGLDAALFYDAGKVEMRRKDLNLKNLETDYGFGFRFNTSAGVVMRVDAAFGSPDGKHLHIVFGGVF